MKSIRVLIVEDQLLIAEGIASILQKFEIKVTGVCRTGEDALREVATEIPDLILMDIKLGGKIDGIETAARLTARRNVPIIYLTDHNDAATFDRAKTTYPSNYLTKPFLESNLIRAIDLAINNYNLKNFSSDTNDVGSTVFLRTEGQSYLKLAYSDILFLQAERAYCKVFTREKTITLSNNMNYIYEQIRHRDFAKVHRSFIVNMTAITGLEGQTIIHIKDHRIPISKEYGDAILQRMKFIK